MIKIKDYDLQIFAGSQRAILSVTRDKRKDVVEMLWELPYIGGFFACEDNTMIGIVISRLAEKSDLDDMEKLIAGCLEKCVKPAQESQE